MQLLLKSDWQQQWKLFHDKTQQIKNLRLISAKTIEISARLALNRVAKIRGGKKIFRLIPAATQIKLHTWTVTIDGTTWGKLGQNARGSKSLPMTIHELFRPTGMGFENLGSCKFELLQATGMALIWENSVWRKVVFSHEQILPLQMSKGVR